MSDGVKIVCLSDLHGYLPEVPDADMLLLAGDYCPTSRREQRGWFATRFAPWLEGISKRMPIVGVAGNHDWFFQDKNDEPLDWTYLQDSGATVCGLKIWGSPWQPVFYDWAFNLDDPHRRLKWELIPADTDVLLLHGPPWGACDQSRPGGGHLGCRYLTARIKEVQPRLVVCGHIHGGRGIARVWADTTICNAAYVNEKYGPDGTPTEIVLSNRQRQR